MEAISGEVREILSKGYVEPHKSLKLKEIFDKYRTQTRGDHGCNEDEKENGKR
jgi:hypothetical protein